MSSPLLLQTHLLSVPKAKRDSSEKIISFHLLKLFSKIVFFSILGNRKRKFRICSTLLIVDPATK